MIQKLLEMLKNLIPTLQGNTEMQLEDNPINDFEVYEDVIASSKSKVNIIIDSKIRSKYRKGWIDRTRMSKLGKTIPVTEIVLHGTAGCRNITDFMNWMFNGERGAEYNKGIALFHFLVGREAGEVIEILDPNYWSWHSSSGSHDKETIGIELLNPSKSNSEVYTDKQYENLISLVFDHLFPIYPTITRIVSHRYNTFAYKARNKKQCPGIRFDWALLDKELRRRGYTFLSDGQCRYEIKKSNEHEADDNTTLKKTKIKIK